MTNEFQYFIVQQIIVLYICLYDFVSSKGNIVQIRGIHYGNFFSTWEEMKNRPPNKTYREPKTLISEIKKQKEILQFWYATLQKFSNGLTWTFKANDQNTHYTHKTSKNVKPCKLPIYQN